MKYRTLGKTGLNVSEIGYGAWGIGKSAWIGASDGDSLKALHHLTLRFLRKNVGTSRS
jgi:aryl-alcohol dehydrogenase-like predicted oxidoreductase